MRCKFKPSILFTNLSGGLFPIVKLLTFDFCHICSYILVSHCNYIVKRNSGFCLIGINIANFGLTRSKMQSIRL
jgi:hypothetical protein